MFGKIISGYKWNSLVEILKSILPSIKYQLTIHCITLSSLAVLIESLFGFNSYTMIAFLIAALVELGTGIYCSIWVRQEKFESGKMGRFCFKFTLMLVGFYIVHQFQNQFIGNNDFIAGAFEWLYNFLFVWQGCEYLISILENKAEIEGKEKDFYSKKIKTKLDNLFT